MNRVTANPPFFNANGLRAQVPHVEMLLVFLTRFNLHFPRPPFDISDMIQHNLHGFRNAIALHENKDPNISSPTA
jgi:hypothetical protein